ncbi:hypothetical protein BH23ACT12_BH23ACT12_07830 [soil metagenome]
MLPALADFIRSGLSLQVTLDRPAEKLLAGLRERKYDLVVSTAAPDAGALAVTDLYREEFVLVAAPAVASKVTGSNPQALQGLPLISFSADRPLIRRY